MSGPAASASKAPFTAAAAGEPAYPSLWQAWYAVAVLMLVTFTALLDRYLPSIAVEAIKQDLQLNDTAISVIQGLAFSLFYCLAGIPFGRLVDRRSRRNLVLIALAVWTVMTILSGLARTFTEMVIARAGVGIAEAVLAPATYSILADYFPPKLRGRAIGIYFTSIILGSAASFILGGAILGALTETPVALPFVGVLPPWRATFVLLALIGIPAFLIGLTLREPVRRGVADLGSKGTLGPFLRENARTLLLLYGALGILAFVSTISLSWAPALYTRNYGISPAQAATMVGAALLIGPFIGSFVSGFFGDYWAMRPGAGRLKVQIWSILLATPLLIAWPLVTDTPLRSLMITLTAGFISFGMASIAATIQSIAPNQLRGQLFAISAINLLLMSALSTTAVALMTDYVFRDPMALPQSIAIVGGLFGVIGCAVAFAASRPYAAMRVM